MIDRIKASDEKAVCLNIFKVHNDAIWRDVKDSY